MTLNTCPRCKRRTEDGCDSWCPGVPEMIETPGPAPVTVRWIEPSIQPTAQEGDKGRRFRADVQTVVLDRSATKLAKPGTSCEVLAVDDNPPPVKRKPSKPKPSPNPAAVAERSCEKCGASLAGRHAYTRFCSNACRKSAQYVRLKGQAGEKVTSSRGLAPKDCAKCGDQFQPYRSSSRYCSSRCRKNAGNAKRSEWFAAYHRKQRREKALAEAGATAETRICCDCGKPKPIGLFRPAHGHGRRKDCIDCHGAKVIAGKARKRGAA